MLPPRKLNKYYRPVVYVTFVITVMLAHAAWAQSDNAPVESSQSALTPTAPEPAEPTQPQQAVVTEITGENVEFSTDSGQTFAPARTGVRLGQDAVVRTGFASSCELSFDAQTLIRIHPLSSVTIGQFLTGPGRQQVRANLDYGAIRCGVEKGAVRADTRISTPVSTLSVRGTITYLEYDPGTCAAILGVVEDGPADALVGQTVYELAEGMQTNEKLSRFLREAIFERIVWPTGNYALGDLTDMNREATGYYLDDTLEPAEGNQQYGDQRSIEQQRTSLHEFYYPGGGIPIGDPSAR